MIVLTAFAVVLALQCLGIGGWVTFSLAAFLFLLLVLIAADASVRELTGRFDALLLESIGLRRRQVGDDTLEMLRDTLPGRGRPQASGVSRHDDTGIRDWTPAQMAFIRGDTDELPGE